jgi:hypothetical protein
MRQAGVSTGVSVWALVGLMAVGLCLGPAGCASPTKADPQKGCAQASPGCCAQPLIVTAPAVTPDMLASTSSTFVDQQNVQPSIQQRGWTPMASYYDVPAVQHGPLYFEDEMENVGAVNSNCPAGYTWLDFVSIPYCDARWMLNTIALPVSMVASPPWQTMCSDGVPGKRPLGLTFDAAPCPKPIPTPFDLKSSERQAADLAQLTGGPVASTPTPAGPATQPAK